MDRLAALRADIAGEVVMPGDITYDTHRKIWNADVDRRPAVIVRASSEADVVAALAFARAEGLEVAVRSGGHSFSGLSAIDGGLVINLRRMNRITVDAEARRAIVQAGCVWGEVDKATQRHGLAVTGGQVSHTGVAGLTLGGGMGFAMRANGLTIDHLAAVRVVTADGRVLRASEDENADLFFGLRGGGGNFGVATEFEFRLNPLGPVVLGGQIGWSREQGPQFLRQYVEFLRNCPDELMTTLIYMTMPPLAFVPQALRGQPAWLLSVCGTDIPKAESALASLRRCGPPAFDVIQPMPYLVVQTFLNNVEPFGTRLYGKSHLFQEVTEELLLTLHAQVADLPTTDTKVVGLQMGGAVRRMRDEDTAFTGRQAAMAMMFGAEWTQPHQRERCVEWADRAWAATRPFARGAYHNFAGQFDDDALRTIYGSAKYDRLRELKVRYDPDNVFHHNHNIKPSLPGRGVVAPRVEAPEAAAATVMRVGRLVIGAFDIEASAAFYCDVLGFSDLGASTHTAGARALRFHDAGGGAGIDLDLIGTLEYWRLPNPFHVALEVGAPSFESVPARLERRDVKIISDPPPMIDTGGFGAMEVRGVSYRRYFFPDPTLIFVELVHRLPAAGDRTSPIAPPSLRVNHLVVGAQDVFASSAFYCELFDFKDLGSNPHKEGARTLVNYGADGSEQIEFVIYPWEECLAPNPVSYTLDVDAATFERVRLRASNRRNDAMQEGANDAGGSSIDGDRFSIVDPSGTRVEVRRVAS